MSEHIKGEIELFTLKGKLPKIRELKMPHSEASHFVASVRVKGNGVLFKLDFGYGKKEDLANAERLVKCWSCHDGLVAACRKLINCSDLSCAKCENECCDEKAPYNLAKAALEEAKNK